MSVRCRGPWRVHKRISEADRWLEDMGYFRKHTARDASCLFRAVAEIVYTTQQYHQTVRQQCLRYMTENKHLFQGSLSIPLDKYVEEISRPSESGGFVEISAMSHLYRRDFVIFDANKGPQTKISNGYGNTIYLFHSPDTKHFDIVYTKEYINKSSFCQSLIYEILYDGVYKLKDLSYAVDKMLHEKASNHIEYFLAENLERHKKKDKAKIYVETEDGNNNAVALKCKHHTDLERASVLKESLSIFVFNRSLLQLDNICISCLNVSSAKDLLDNGITPFPYKVAKALDPDIYRNIEFDVWTEMRRELRFAARYSDGTTLQVGVKCLCRLHDDQIVPYHCHVQEMARDGGPCVVFVEELGEMRALRYDQLEPLPASEAKPWAPPYRHARSHVLVTQMLQQIGTITRKQSLGKLRKAKSEVKSEENGTPKNNTKISWHDLKDEEEEQQQEYCPQAVNQSAMVDCRQGAPQELAPNGAPPPDTNHQNQINQGAPVEVSHVSSPATPATTPALATYGPGMPMGGMGGYAPYYGGGKMGGVVWMPPPLPPPLPPPPHHVNTHVYKSVQPNGSDLPLNDMATLRYYFNLGVECMWAAFGPPPAPPRHYPPRDIAQDMQAMSLNERANNSLEHKHKPPHDKMPAQNKGNGQRSLLGPRFNKRGNQDNNQNQSHHQNKGYNNNNNLPNKGPNNRRNSHERGFEPECPEPAMVPVPYIPYPPPVYPLHYYHVDANEPAMMGMMGGMGYMGYEEGGEYAPAYYPQPMYPPHLPPAPHLPAPLPPPPAPHNEHK